MKKQTLIRQILAALTLGILLSACPSVEPLPQGPSLTPLSAFPKEHLSCCWQDLVKVEPNYPTLALDALNGNLEALASLLKLSSKLELATSYAHGAVLVEILPRIGDSYFTTVLTYLNKKGDLKEKSPLLEETLFDTLRNLLEGGFALNKDPKIHQQNLSAYTQTAEFLEYQIKVDPKTKP